MINEGPKESVYANKLGGGGHEFTIHDSTYDMYCVIDRTYYMHRFASTFTVKTLIAAAEIVRFFFKKKQTKYYILLHAQPEANYYFVKIFALALRVISKNLIDKYIFITKDIHILKKL